MSKKFKIHPDFEVDYGHKLGQGSFGDVFRGIWIPKNSYVAIKRLKDHISNSEKMMRDEVEIMKQFHHQNILNFIDVFKADDQIFIISEYCEGGSLKQEIDKNKIPEQNSFSFLKQLVLGMAMIQKSNHLHRDIKPDNILFTNERMVKICDFGTARRIIGDDPKKMELFSFKGTPLYSAPQVLCKQPYSIKCDVWSVGVILVEMLIGVNPFESAKTIPALISLQKKLLQGPGYYSLKGPQNSWFKLIVSRMLAYNQQDRWCFDQLKQNILESQITVLKQINSLKNINVTSIKQQTSDKSGPQTMLNILSTAESTEQKVQILKMVRKKKTQKPVIKIINEQTTQWKAEIQNKNKNKIAELKLYIAFLYARGKLFADMVTKYFQTVENKRTSKYIKMMYLFFALTIYIKHIQKSDNVLNKQKIFKLPNGTVIVYQGLEASNIERVQKIKQDFQQQMKPQIAKFMKTIKKIFQSLTSQKYKLQFPEEVKRCGKFVELIGKVKSEKCNESYQFYEDKIRQFFKQECIENIGNIHQGFLRVYYGCLILEFLQGIAPQTKFKDEYCINEIYQTVQNMEIQDVKNQVAKMHVDLGV